MGDVGFLPGTPLWLGYHVGIRTACYDVRHRSTKPIANLLELGLLVFDGIMQQRRHRLVLVRAVLQCDTGHAEEMSDVWDSRPLPDVTGVSERCKLQGVVKA